MDNMRRVLVFKLTQGDFKKYKSLGSKMNEIGKRHGENIHKRIFHKESQTLEVDISFKSEDAMLRAFIEVSDLLAENGIKRELIRRERVLPKEIERDLKEFKEAVASL